MTGHVGPRATRAKGKLKKAVGNITGDRHVEAVGWIEATTGHEPDDREERYAEFKIRRDHGDIPDVPRRGSTQVDQIQREGGWT